MDDSNEIDDDEEYLKMEDEEEAWLFGEEEEYDESDEEENEEYGESDEEEDYDESDEEEDYDESDEEEDYGESDEEEDYDESDEEEDWGRREDHELTLAQAAEAAIDEQTDEAGESEDEEDYDDEDEENPEESYDFSEEDELEPQSHCMTCGVDDIKANDRWNFKITREDGTEEPAWICRTCHAQFGSVEIFNKFMANEQYRRLYMKASTLMRLLALGAPLEIVAKTLFSGMPSVLFWTDEYDGSEEARRLAREELEKVAEKYLGNRKD